MEDLIKHLNWSIEDIYKGDPERWDRVKKCLEVVKMILEGLVIGRTNRSLEVEEMGEKLEDYKRKVLLVVELAKRGVVEETEWCSGWRSACSVIIKDINSIK